MNDQEHIHTPDDGRGSREVFIDGEIVKGVTYADTKLGIVRWGWTILQKTRRGKVEVRFK